MPGELLTIGFLSYALEISFIFISWSFPTQCSVHLLPQHYLFGSGHSWADYIYSPPTRYSVSWPFVIQEITSVLPYSLIKNLGFTDFTQFFTRDFALGKPIHKFPLLLCTLLFSKVRYALPGIITSYMFPYRSDYIFTLK